MNKYLEYRKKLDKKYPISHLKKRKCVLSPASSSCFMGQFRRNGRFLWNKSKHCKSYGHFVKIAKRCKSKHALLSTHTKLIVKCVKRTVVINLLSNDESRTVVIQLSSKDVRGFSLIVKR